MVLSDNPAEDPQARGDPFKTLFVSRLSYDVTEADLEREFGRFGPIERVRPGNSEIFFVDTDFCAQIRIVADANSQNKKKPHRGYAFIVYEREKDMKGTESRTFKLFPSLINYTYPVPSSYPLQFVVYLHSKSP